jgi:hypothetical protein
MPPPLPSQSHAEPYGAVPYPVYSAAVPTPRRRAAPSPYILSPAPYGVTQSPATVMSHQKHQNHSYEHNSIALVFLLGPLALLLWNHVSEAPLQALISCALVLYSLDLANLRDACMIGMWVCFALVSGTNSWTLLMATDDHEATGGTMLVIIFRMMVETLFFLCLVSHALLEPTILLFYTFTIPHFYYLAYTIHYGTFIGSDYMDQFTIQMDVQRIAGLDENDRTNPAWLFSSSFCNHSHTTANDYAS